MVELSLEEARHGDPRLDRRLKTDDYSPADVAVMLRSNAVAAGYRPLRLPDELAQKYGAENWRLHGLNLTASTVTAERWYPEWLDHHGSIPPDEAPSRRTQRRTDASVPADPFYEQLCGFPRYRTVGQRDALRAVAVADAGDTVICALPTASGKSDVILTRALRQRPRQTVIIVPTVALAVDLEQRVQDRLGSDDRYAYHGDLESVEKERIRTGIEDGSQWLTITSPEAACSSLARPLKAAAEHGRLDLIAVDEAHIVAEWGDDFRPAFHTFAALRRTLIEISPAHLAPVTALLSGTLDSYGLASLKRLFAGRSTVLVCAQSTRPEPAWWSAKCDDEQQKRDRLIEAMCRLPRPALIYVSLHTSSRSSNTATVLAWLEQAGFAAVAAIDSRSKARQRHDAVRGLRLAGESRDDLDVVVATSSFGLGIDIDDIRTVIHLCVPESVDRLYQEVGRSGRDGHATASLVLWTDADQLVADDLARARLIGADKAWQRWSSMRDRGAWESDRLTVNLTAAHAGVRYPWSDANLYWNTQTLAAMERAGMIRRYWPEPAQAPQDADDDELADFFDAQRTAAILEILDSDISDESVFRRRFQHGRQASHAATTAALDAAVHVLQSRPQCTSRYLASRYELGDPDGNVFPMTVACGGCPVCRREGTRPFDAPAFNTMASGQVMRTADDRLRSLAPEGRLSVRTDGLDPRAERTLLARLARHGVITLIAPRPDMVATSGANGPWWVENVRDWSVNSDEPWRVPTALWVDATVDDDVLELALSRLAKQPFGVLIVPSHRLDPTNTKQYLHEAWTPTYSIDDLLRRL